MRAATIKRETRETQIALTLHIDGSGQSRVDCQVEFFGHMLEAFSRHGLFDLDLRARGDLGVEAHHLVEDCGWVLGQAFSQALGDRSGIARSGFFLMPMDEALAEVAIDLCGRSHCVFLGDLGDSPLGTFPPALSLDFLIAFSQAMAANFHVAIRCGRNDHHKLEAMFKALGRALRAACQLEPRLQGQALSSKGVI
jgi:imidazoleglycerol-phosphate dehydratase